MGEVWSAHDEVLNRTVAIKVIRPHLADDENIRARLQVEAQLAGSLSHPGIVDVFDYGEDEVEGRVVPFLVMRHVDGAPLSQILRERTTLTLGETMAIVADVADALQTAHAAGIVHRDLKLANILLSTTGQVLLVDFGIARSVGGESLTQTGALIGTADYLSPEQSSGQSATPLSDLYALGVVAYTCLTGTLPFRRDSDIATALAHIQSPVPELPADALAPGAGPFVEELLSKDPVDRPQSAAQVAMTARQFATDVPLPSHPGSETPSPQVANASPLLQDTQPGAADVATAALNAPTTPTAPGTSPTEPAAAMSGTAVNPRVPAETSTSEAPASHAERRGPRRLIILSSALVLLALVVAFLMFSGGTQVTVPDVRGMTAAEATATLQSAGLEIETTTVDVADRKADEVVDQSPSPGEDVDEGAVVEVTVASGLIAIPSDLVGMTYAEAAEELEKLGLRPRRVNTASTKAAGTVLGVEPRTPVKAGAAVTLAVAQGPSSDTDTGDTSDQDSNDDKSKPKKPTSSATPSPEPTTPSPPPTSPSPSPAATAS